MHSCRRLIRAGRHKDVLRLSEHLPDAGLVPANSNAAAAQEVAAGRADAGGDDEPRDIMFAVATLPPAVPYQRLQEPPAKAAVGTDGTHGTTGHG